MTRFAIFEPWGLGDLCVALHAARAMHAAGHSVVIVCNPAWSKWAQSLSYVETVIPFLAPWAQKRRKYDPRCYNVKKILECGRLLRTKGVDVVIDIRADIRHRFFLSIVWRRKIVTVDVEKTSNRYDRPFNACKKLGIPYKLPEGRPALVTERKIACAFHAAWKNRELPQEKSFELVEKLLGLGWKVLLIVPNETRATVWSSLKKANSDQLELICTDIISMSQKLKSARLCIAVDSGIMHLAYLNNVPTVALFGFNNQNEWLPPNVNAITINNPHPIERSYILSQENIQPLATLDIAHVIGVIQVRDNALTLLAKDPLLS